MAVLLIAGSRASQAYQKFRAIWPGCVGFSHFGEMEFTVKDRTVLDVAIRGVNIDQLKRIVYLATPDVPTHWGYSQADEEFAHAELGAVVAYWCERQSDKLVNYRIASPRYDVEFDLTYNLYLLQRFFPTCSIPSMRHQACGQVCALLVTSESYIVEPPIIDSFELREATNAIVRRARLMIEHLGLQYVIIEAEAANNLLAVRLRNFWPFWADAQEFSAVLKREVEPLLRELPSNATGI